MISVMTKRVTFAMILFLSIMQLLLPFLHIHYNGDQAHENVGSQVLHLHTLEDSSLSAYLLVDVDADSHTHLVDRTMDSTMIGVDQAVLNQEDVDIIGFSAIFFGLIAFVFITWFIVPASAFQSKQTFHYHRPLSQGPPHA